MTRGHLVREPVCGRHVRVPACGQDVRKPVCGLQVRVPACGQNVREPVCGLQVRVPATVCAPALAFPIANFGLTTPVYSRWWFIALIAAGVVTLGVYAYRQRVRRLLEIERIRTRIAADLHDDIGASLSRMAILIEVVKQEGRQSGYLNEQNFRTAQMLTEIADSARGLVDSMSDIVWSIDPRRDELGQVITRTRQFAADVFDAQGIEWQFLTSAELEKTKLDPEQRRHLFLIFKEALNNIARHAAAKTVSISLTIRGNQLLAEIADDGCGFTPQPVETAVAVVPKSRGGNGLGNMQARAAELNGTLTIDSAPGKGTRLAFAMPLKR